MEAKRQDDDAAVRALLDAIFERYHHDFRQYAMTSTRRRLQVAMDAMGAGSIEQLHRRVLSEPVDFARLLDFLTVSVSEMFRDPPYYRALREQVLPVLATYPSLRLWVAGCASGEEAYSLAILLHEAGLLERSLIYATDIAPRALESARVGVYALERMRRFSENYRMVGGRRSLAEYCRAAHGYAQFDANLRKHIVFSDHCLATDHVFAEVQLVSCRNVLIYFNAALQRRAVGLFVEALCRKGFLGLGARESIRFCGYFHRFMEVNDGARIYQRID